MNLIWIGLAGACGTVARHLLGVAAKSGGFPFATVAVNVLGSFFLAVVTYAGLDRSVLSPELRAILGTGLLGGFTTYSSFNMETIALFQRGSSLLAAANLVATVVLCLLAGLLGLVFARSWLGR